MKHLLIIALVFAGCVSPKAQPALKSTVALGTSTLAIANATAKPVTANFAFGADSVFLPASLPNCATSSALNCALILPANSTQTIDLGGKYLNATLAFDLPVGCGATKAELNLNNPAWYDVADVSLVDGFNHDLQMQFGGTLLGPTLGKNGNAALFGVFPLGCDICTARQNPSCGFAKGTDGCKAGTQYAPVPPCQVQGTVKGGGTAVIVTVLPLDATAT